MPCTWHYEGSDQLLEDHLAASWEVAPDHMVFRPVQRERHHGVALEEARRLRRRARAERRLVQTEAGAQLLAIRERLGHEVDVLPSGRARRGPETMALHLTD